MLDPVRIPTGATGTLETWVQVLVNMFFYIKKSCNEFEEPLQVTPVGLQ